MAQDNIDRYINSYFKAGKPPGSQEEERVFLSLWEQAEPHVSAFAMKFCRHGNRNYDDLMQAARLKLLRRIRNIESPKDSCVNISMLKYSIIDAFEAINKNHQKEINEDIPEDANSNIVYYRPRNNYMGANTANDLKMILNTLSYSDRQIMLLELQGYSQKEIAKMYSCSPAYICKKRQRILEDLVQNTPL